ncbi:hypothetical protein LPN01_17440 [Sphingomonas sp. A2-49]|uniref:head-tail connector protein n=1 Tax=Sphingomonas sp. A2-49 TaxID=1391375 RepID=UPI0021D2F404|nr:hypothetical protein [Sphingomonas sp. A2-49]MCU6455866.1 hypothetical protein [Sphingomonas sp. A2-49]
MRMDGAAMPAAAVAGAAAAAGAYLRIAEAPDAVLTRAAGSALALAETFCGQRLIARGCEDVIGTAQGWRRLASSPVRAIDALAGVPVAGVRFALPVDAYAVDIDAEGFGWVRATATGAATRVAVAYTAGLAETWDALPEPLMQGIVLLTTHLFEHRAGTTAPPAAIAALWRPWRRMRLMPAVRA